MLNSEKSASIFDKTLTAYALQLAKHPSAAKQLEIMQSAAKTADDRMWWSASDHRSQHWWRWVTNGDVEITSYALLTLLEGELVGIDDLLSIVKWLVAQRNSYGGFISTQDTVVGLQALIGFAEKALYEPGIMNVQLLAKGSIERSESIKIDESNGLLLQTVEVRNITLKQKFGLKRKCIKYRDYTWPQSDCRSTVNSFAQNA